MNNFLVITGGSRGIGEKTIAYFLQEGWKAINLSRTPCQLPGVDNIQVDLLEPEQIEEITSTLQSKLKGADNIALVHNAAFYKRDTIDALPIAQLQQTLMVNVVAAITLNQMVIPVMPPKSSIIYIGTTLAEKAVPGSASYTVSKHAIVGLMKATCQDLAGRQIRSCLVNPGLVDTQLLKDTMDKETLTFLLDTQVIGKRLIAPEEIAKVIYFCATNEVINGSIIRANLGQVSD
jgi:NADP-dependent 3-hydroxy acid dehydrogenase YdfG